MQSFFEFTRVVWVFGSAVKDGIQDITPTRLTSVVLSKLREADHIYLQELRAAGLYDQVSQAFTVFLPVRSVGVVGDSRRYEYVIALRAVETIDFMTARWAHLPYEFLERVSSRIIMPHTHGTCLH